MNIFTRRAYRPLNTQTLIRRNMRQLHVKREAKRIAIMGLPESGDTAPTPIEDSIDRKSVV